MTRTTGDQFSILVAVVLILGIAVASCAAFKAAFDLLMKTVGE